MGRDRKRTVLFPGFLVWSGNQRMNRVTGLIAREILRTEKNLFTFRLLAVLASYAGVTYWLNSIRHSAALSVVWCMIGLQLFLYLTIFVVCSLRLRQCRRKAWWIWGPLILSRVNDWEVLLIPLTAIITLILSETNSHISPNRQHLLPAEGDDGSASPGAEPKE